MPQDTRRLFRQTFMKVALFDAAILVVLTALSVLFISRSKTRLAEQLAESFRAPLIAGDNRQIILDMPRPVLKDFLGAIWHPDGNGYAFAVPANLRPSNTRGQGSLNVEIFFDEHQAVKAGRLEFIYNRWEALPSALISWLLLAALSLLIGHYEWKRLLREYKLSLESQINETRATMAAQVAHDIRSPVYALDAALKSMTQLPEQQRVIVRHAVNRIRDVANGLLEKNRQQPGIPATSATAPLTKEPTSIYLLSSLIEPVVTEKRLQYQPKTGINLDFELTSESYGLFAKVQPAEFRRVISNLLNNAIEALGDKGVVKIALSHEGENVLLRISDNGKGIPPEILAKLGNKGETHGKAGGSGLGLYHARTTVENWGGGFAITSESGKGTTTAIKLAKAEAPEYFINAVKLNPDSQVLVLDDDTGIHLIWRGRFESARVQEHGIETAYFSAPEQLRAWTGANRERTAKAVCLFDYELSGHKETGISLAEELGLCAQTIIVTSRSEEPRIIKECERLKLKLIPKALSGYVPIVIEATAPKFAVLLDDDALTHMTWELAAQEHGIDLKAFTNPDEFRHNLGDFPKDVPLYIDSDLGENIKGESIAEELKTKGFTNICLATAHPPEKFAHLPWLKVITKEPPWI